MRQRHTLKELADLTLRVAWSGQKDELGTWANARDVIDAIGPMRHVDSLTTADAQVLRATLRERGLSGGTINRKLAVLSKMLSVALDAGWTSHPIRIKREKEVAHRVRILTPAEESLMVQELVRVGKGPQLGELCIFLVETGLRVSEALDLRWEDIHLDGDTKWARIWRNKGNRPRSVPLTRVALGVLSALDPKAGAGPFAGISQNVFNHAWKAARDAAGFGHDREFVPHALRHTCATRLLNSGASVPVVQRWLGHGNIQTTMRYVHMSDAQLANAAAALEAASAARAEAPK